MLTALVWSRATLRALPVFALVTVLLALSLSGAEATAATPSRPLPSGHLFGQVTDLATRAGLGSAYIVVVEVKRQWLQAVQTSGRGYYSLNLPAGRYTITASQAGYGPTSRTVSIKVGMATVLHLALQRVIGAPAVTGAPSGALVRGGAPSGAPGYGSAPLDASLSSATPPSGAPSGGRSLGGGFSGGAASGGAPPGGTPATGGASGGAPPAGAPAAGTPPTPASTEPPVATQPPSPLTPPPSSPPSPPTPPSPSPPSSTTPPPPVPRTSSAPIIATAGQIIRGVKITSASGPCITIDNVANVWVDNVELGPCAGNGVRITGPGATGIRVTNSLIHTERAGPNDTGVGVYIYQAANTLVQGNQFAYNESSVYAIQATNINVIGNYSLNPLGPFPRGQHVQFNNVAGGQVSDNFGESRTTNVQYQPNQEDAINLWQSQQIQILRNYLVGGSSTTGCGLIFDGMNNSNNLLADNIVIRTAQCGIGVASGVNNVVRGNKVLDPNIPGGGNIGIYVWNQYPGTCSGITVENNIVSNLLPNGTYSDYWDSGTCGSVLLNGNILGSAARLLLTPESAMLPPPPKPPKPYVAP